MPFTLNPDALANFELGARYRGESIYVYEFRWQYKVFFACSIRGQMLEILEVTKNKAIVKAKSMIDAIESETQQQKTENRNRLKFEKGQGY